MGTITQHSILANDLNISYFAAGLDNDGPLAICLHGFPDSAHTWRHLLPRLADAGYRAVAPFLRGYAPTEVPSDGRFQTAASAMDVLALRDALGGGADSVIIGHDWGAIITHIAANVRPDAFALSLIHI
jgi:pimeloyl-ACP methyl ester carboxylesterase